MILTTAALLLSTASAAPAFTGEYVEARTCAVYTGACHANGERVTTGREGIMAWHVARGKDSGIDLSGLDAVAIVTANDNLAAKECNRSSLIYVSESASEKQREALVDVLQEKYGCALGRIIAIKRAPIEFSREGLKYTVRVPNTVYLKTTRSICNHCVMPHQVWYQPLAHVKDSLVAMASLNEFKGAPELQTTWSRQDENSSFVGKF